MNLYAFNFVVCTNEVHDLASLSPFQLAYILTPDYALPEVPPFSVSSIKGVLFLFFFVNLAHDVISTRRFDVRQAAPRRTSAAKLIKNIPTFAADESRRLLDLMTGRRWLLKC